jgi:hypothetical protein
MDCPQLPNGLVVVLIFRQTLSRTTPAAKAYEIS